MGIDLLEDALDAPEDGEVVFRWVQWNVNDYLAGTAALPLELEGAYMRFLMHLYSHGKPLPDDDAWMARLLRISVRVWKRVKAALAALGKIIIRNKSLTNSRFEAERIKRAEDHQKRAAAAHKRWAEGRSKKAAKSESLPKVSPKFAQNFEETSAEKSKKPNKINEPPVNEDMQIQKDINTEIQKDKILGSSNLTDSELSERLEAAAAACLKNPAAAPGLLVLSEPRRWIEQGCDLEKDILPAIKAVAAKRPPRSVATWGYFTSAVVDARATRAAPLPEGQAQARKGGETFAERQRRFLRGVRY